MCKRGSFLWLVIGLITFQVHVHQANAEATPKAPIKIGDISSQTNVPINLNETYMNIEARLVRISGCTYPSGAIPLEIEATLVSSQLPEDSRVEWVSGVRRRDQSSHPESYEEWIWTESTPTQLVEKSTWKAHRMTTFGERSSPKITTDIQFAWLVTTPDQKVFWIKGSDTLYGFFRSSIAELRITCNTPDPLIDLPIVAIGKN